MASAEEARREYYASMRPRVFPAEDLLESMSITLQ